MSRPERIEKEVKRVHSRYDAPFAIQRTRPDGSLMDPVAPYQLEENVARELARLRVKLRDRQERAKALTRNLLYRADRHAATEYMRAVQLEHQLDAVGLGQLPDCLSGVMVSLAVGQRSEAAAQLRGIADGFRSAADAVEEGRAASPGRLEEYQHTRDDAREAFDSLLGVGCARCVNLKTLGEARKRIRAFARGER